MEKELKGLRLALRASALFALISFVWSLSGSLYPFPSKFGEYTSSAILTEVTGHVFFGLVAGAFSLDLGLALTCGAASILIDLDHVLPALGFPALARTTHSVLFTVVAALAVTYALKPGRRKATLSIALAASVLAHLSYDVFAGDGVFPLFAPISFTLYSFPYWSWLPLEGGAAFLTLLAVLARRRCGRSTVPVGGHERGNNIRSTSYIIGICPEKY